MEETPKNGKLKTKNLLLDNQEEIDKAFKKAVKNALLENKRAGNSIAVWRDERIVLIPPDEIVVEEI